jgi:hypothetical protein
MDNVLTNNAKYNTFIAKWEKLHMIANTSGIIESFNYIVNNIVGSRNMIVPAVSRIFQTERLMLANIFHQCVGERELIINTHIDENSKENRDLIVENRLNKILSFINHSESIVIRLLLLNKTQCIKDFESLTAKFNDRSNSISHPTKTADYKLYEKILRYLEMYQYKLHDEHLYLQKYTIINNKQYPTYYWKRQLSLREFIQKNLCTTFGCKEELAGRPVKLLNDIISFINDYDHYEFTRLKILRGAFSFKNGVFITEFDHIKDLDDSQKCYKMFSYDNQTNDDQPKYIQDTGRFILYGSSKIDKFMGGYVTKKYFDCNFDPIKIQNEYFSASDPLTSVNQNYKMYLGDWYQIKTPKFQKILDDQHLNKSVCKILYILLGRLLYETASCPIS